MPSRRAPGPPIWSAPFVLQRLSRRPLEYLVELRERYGDIVRVPYPARPGLWLAAHPDGVKHVLQDRHRNYNKDTPRTRVLRDLLGEGLLTSEGRTWLQQRRLIQPAFHRQRIAAIGELVVERTQALLERWRAQTARGEAINIADAMSRLTLDIVTRALFGVDANTHITAVRETMTILGERFLERSDSLLGLLFSGYGKGRKRAENAALKLYGVVDEIIARRRRAHEAGDDMLGMLIDLRDEETGQAMTDQQLRDETLTMLLAGHETTANALTWTWYLLSRHPEERARIESEIDLTLAHRSPRIEDFPRLALTRMALDETMRLYPPAWGLARSAIEEDEILGYRIRPRSIVLLSPWVLHRHPDFWEEPETFRPERFAPECAKKRHRFAYFPFGGGPRQCIGNQFALTEATLVIATIAQRCRLHKISEEPAAPRAVVTLQPAAPLLLRPEFVRQKAARV